MKEGDIVRHGEEIYVVTMPPVEWCTGDGFTVQLKIVREVEELTDFAICPECGNGMKLHKQFARQYNYWQCYVCDYQQRVE